VRRHRLTEGTHRPIRGDLDAPDLITPTNQTSAPAKPAGRNLSGQSNGRLNGGQPDLAPTAASRRDQVHSISTSATRDAEASAQLRDRLVAELNELGSGDDAAVWAHNRLAEKDRMASADAQRVEDAFAARITVFASHDTELALKPRLAKWSMRPQRVKPRSPRIPVRRARKRRSGTIDKSVLAFPEPRRIRDRDHVRFIAKQPCLVCGRQPSDPHHVRFAQRPTLGRKVADEFTVPLCRGHHRELHRCGD
jgi:hypothetical protein